MRLSHVHRLPFVVDWPHYAEYPRSPALTLAGITGSRAKPRGRTCGRPRDSFIGISALSVILMCSGHTLRAALGDVAEAQTVLFLRHHRTTIERVQRMHVELGLPHQIAGSGERRLVLLVITHHVARVLAQEALDALAETPVSGSRPPASSGTRRAAGPFGGANDGISLAFS